MRSSAPSFYLIVIVDRWLGGGEHEEEMSFITMVLSGFSSCSLEGSLKVMAMVKPLVASSGVRTRASDDVGRWQESR